MKTRGAKPGLIVFAGYLKDELRLVSPWALCSTMLMVAVLITLNYTVGIETRIRLLNPWPLSLLGFFLFYGAVFWGAWGIQTFFDRKETKNPAHDPGQTHLNRSDKPRPKTFFVLLALAPLYFAFKIIHWDLSPFFPSSPGHPWHAYTRIVLQWPLKLLLLILILSTCQKWSGNLKALGLTTKGASLLPYLQILLCLTPLVALASTQSDFLHAYPKSRSIAFIAPHTHPFWPWRLLFELCYGLDFVSIELFFRGWLVIGLSRWAGSKAILPMAAFYCTIHFGKPLGECITAFGGGLALGVLAWRTRSILGGLMVHLGLAWMMEIGGWLGAGG